MKRVKVILRGSEGDHVVTSPWLADDQAAADLAEIRRCQETGDQISCDWLSTFGGLVLAVLLEDQPVTN